MPHWPGLQPQPQSYNRDRTRVRAHCDAEVAKVVGVAFAKEADGDDGEEAADEEDDEEGVEDAGEGGVERGDELLERLDGAEQAHDAEDAGEAEELEGGRLGAELGDEGGDDDDGVEPVPRVGDELGDGGGGDDVDGQVGGEDEGEDQVEHVNDVRCAGAVERVELRGNNAHAEVDIDHDGHHRLIIGAFVSGAKCIQIFLNRAVLHGLD